MSRSDRSTGVLIVSPDVTGAALIGALVETLGYTVSFAAATEPTDASLRRVRPRIYLIDCRTTTSGADEVVGRAIMRGVGVVLIGPSRLLGPMRELGGRHDLEVVLLPTDPGPLGEALARAARKSG